MAKQIEVTYTNLEYPPGKKFAIKGIGVLINGEPVVVDSDEYKRATGRTVQQALAHRGDFTIRPIKSNTGNSVGGDK